VDLSGKRVVFLVDKSGSMTLRRDSEPDPLKWPTVTQTLEHIMKSMPKVEQYQVIVFSSRAESLFGDTDWRTFQRDTSPQEAATALAKVVPQGGTNLYSGFEAAYRLQEKGLDTIILVSDGLPSAGLNMPEGADSRTLGRQVLELVRLRHRTSAVRIHSIGFFYESPELGSFLWTLSRETGGNFVGMSKP
jgi:Mg-chelatase subunit ChlD